MPKRYSEDALWAFRTELMNVGKNNIKHYVKLLKKYKLLTKILVIGPSINMTLKAEILSLILMMEIDTYTKLKITNLRFTR